MADLFSMKSPLMIRCPGGESHVMAEYFRHPQGLLYFDLFWTDYLDQDNALQKLQPVVHLVQGEYSGEGPWKVGDAVISVLGCHGCDARLASEFASWQSFLKMAADSYPEAEKIHRIAQYFGAL